MNNKIHNTLIAILVCVFCAGAAQAELVNESLAGKIAQGWVTMITELNGDWGGSKTAEVINIKEFRRDGQLLGYYCEVAPNGFMLISLVKGLAPVKAWSATSRLDPLLEEGPTGLMKDQLGRVLKGVVDEFGSLADANPESLEQIIGANHLPTWEMLVLDDIALKTEMTSRGMKDIYGEGDELLTSNWHQGSPYYDVCPPAYNGCTDPRCPVGCVATAGAQIMRYWSWPPGEGWGLMPDTLTDSSPQDWIDAVSIFCLTVGVLVGMDYCSNGCLSSAFTEDMVSVYTALNYSDSCSVVDRRGVEQADWFNLIVKQINLNRPIQYRISKHSIVCDGYRTTPYPQYHMNYGWANSFNTWYAIDSLHQPDPDGNPGDEYLIRIIVPQNALGAVTSGFHLRPLREPFYWYVDQDCSATAATFSPGQNIQFLHDMKLTCVRDSISFYSGADDIWQTKLMPYDPSMGIKLSNGGRLRFSEGGEVRIEGPPRNR